MSVMKPGVSSSTPPKITSTPSMTSRCGTRPPASASLKRRQAARLCVRSSHEPRIASAISSRIVHHTPISLADLDQHRQLGDRDDDEEEDEEQRHGGR